MFCSVLFYGWSFPCRAGRRSSQNSQGVFLFWQLHESHPCRGPEPSRAAVPCQDTEPPRGSLGTNRREAPERREGTAGQPALPALSGCTSLHNGTRGSAGGQEGRSCASSTRRGPFECQQGRATRPPAQAITAHIIGRMSLGHFCTHICTHICTQGLHRRTRFSDVCPVLSEKERPSRQTRGLANSGKPYVPKNVWGCGGGSTGRYPGREAHGPTGAAA